MSIMLVCSENKPLTVQMAKIGDQLVINHVITKANAARSTDVTVSRITSSARACVAVTSSAQISFMDVIASQLMTAINKVK